MTLDEIFEREEQKLREEGRKRIAEEQAAWNALSPEEQAAALKAREEYWDNLASKWSESEEDEDDDDENEEDEDF